MSACSSIQDTATSSLFLNERKTLKPLFFHSFHFWKLSGIYLLAINTCLPKSTTSSQSASCCDGYYPYMSIWYPEDWLVEFFRGVEHKFFTTHAFVSIKNKVHSLFCQWMYLWFQVICPYQRLILSQRTNIFSPDFTALMGLYFLKAMFYIQQLQ